jgi:hypothetical protein
MSLLRSFTSMVAAALVAVMSFTAPASAQAAQPTNAALSFPITTTAPQGVFNGTLRITSFGVQNNALVASGIVTGTLVSGSGVAQAVAKSVSIPVAISGAGKTVAATTAAAPKAAASCDILHLELGPVDLDLLGLVLHLDRVVLDLSAAPGAGNLLGNLLCSVTNLLNGSNLSQLANLLNQILGLLG